MGYLNVAGVFFKYSMAEPQNHTENRAIPKKSLLSGFDNIKTTMKTNSIPMK
jgi:hypothetical protein